MNKTVTMAPIGFLRTDVRDIPRHWSVSQVEGTIVINEEYVDGLADIIPGRKIAVLFWFHQSPRFAPRYLRQTPPHRKEALGVFSICSPLRPNPIGMSVLTVLEINQGKIRVKGIDMLDGTPILDIKPHITGRRGSPGYKGDNP